MPSTITIGLDGATWRLLNDWIDDGHLPALEIIVDEGHAATLESCLPPVTAPNWKCFSTSRNPGGLGVYWWEMLSEDHGNYEITHPNSTSYRQPELWDYLNECGLRSGVVNMPTTYPPKQVAGAMVSGGPDSEEHGFTTPTELEDTLKQQFSYRCLPNRLSFLKDEDSAAINEAIDLVEKRFYVAEYIADSYDIDYLHLSIYLSNVFHHFFWDSHHTLNIWETIDAGIQRLRDEFNDANFILFSDHGSNEIDMKFYINLWLQKQNYLVTTTGSRAKLGEAFYRIGITRDRLAKLATKLGIKTTLKRLLSERARNTVPTRTGSIRSKAKNDLIDWERTDAFAFGQGPIYVFNDNKRDKIKTALESLTYNGIPIAQTIYEGKEIYKDGFGMVPDLVIEQHEGIHISNSLGFDDVFVKPHKWRAENERRGIFAAAGPDIETDTSVDVVSILDVAPTVMASLNVPVAESMEGKIIPIIDEQTPDRAPYSQVVSSAETLDQSDTRQRLEDLGYME